MEPFLGSLAAPSADESHVPRDPPQLRQFRIPPLREAVPSRTLAAPSPLEPSAGRLRKSNLPKAHPGNSNPPTELPTLADFLNAARSEKLAEYTPSSLEPLPKPILPFINLRTVENLSYPFDEETPRKRARLDLQEGFGDHLHLPAPKIRQETPKLRSFGPLAILNGLNEPPPNAALFPPIETNSAPTILTRPSRDKDEERVRQTRDDARRHDIREIIDPITKELDEDPRGKNTEAKAASEQGVSSTDARSDQVPEDKSSQFDGPKKSAPRKKLRKWTDEETADLLRGVVRCGVGSWTAILSQPDLKFVDRTAANLKDRFRVCCPWAYDSGDKSASEAVQARLADVVSRSECDLTGKILLPDPRKTKSNAQQSQESRVRHSAGINDISILLQTPVACSAPGSSMGDSSNTNPGKKKGSNAQGSQALLEKSESTLRSLGLQDPQSSVKSNRRPRRPFTQEEDDALLKGYNIHGFQWSLIQQDTRLNLMHRKATVLRDRFRTRFPVVYKDGGVTTISVEDREGTPGDGSTKSDKLPRTSKAPPTVKSALQPSIANLSNPTPKPARHSHALPNSALRNGTAAPIDPVLLPPAPPSSLPDFSKINSQAVFPPTLDEQSSGPGEGGDMRWGDNTLPPPVWDEIG